MSIETCFHARQGPEFLGMRVTKAGSMEVVYDSGRQTQGLPNRHVWRVQPNRRRAGALSYADQAQLADALRTASAAPRVLCCLFTEMKKRAIVLESVPQ